MARAPVRRSLGKELMRARVHDVTKNGSSMIADQAQRCCEAAGIISAWFLFTNYHSFGAHYEAIAIGTNDNETPSTAVVAVASRFPRGSNP